jgi:hypothetical protein
MGSVMMDRWGIENAIEYLGGDIEKYKHKDKNFYYGEKHPCAFFNFDLIDNSHRNPKTFKNCWENFITALILWDEIWTFNRRFIYNWKQSFDNKNLANKLEDIIYQVDFNMIDDSLTNIYEILDRASIAVDHHCRERTLCYQLISNALGVPFLAHPSRYQSDLIDDIPKMIFTRQDIINRIDKELLDYYNHINEKMGRVALNFKYPVLIDMIRKETSTIEEELDMALKIRNYNDTVTFREQIFEIEQIINRGDTQALLAELKMVSDLAEDITIKYTKEYSIGYISISLNPSLTIPLKIKKNKKNALHATFIEPIKFFV